MDGNYSVVREVIWPRATSVIWLNYLFPTIVWRGLRRTVRRCVIKEELWSGNRESVSTAFFSRDSILWWLVTSHGRLNRQYRFAFDSEIYPNAAKIEFRTPGEASRSLLVI